MANTTITKILVRRGPEADRNDITPTMGEPVWTTDTHRLFVGDGETSGGREVIDVDDRFFVYQQRGPTDQLPEAIPLTGSTKHNVMTVNPNMSGNIKTSGIIESTNASNGCQNGAIRATGGISCGGDLNCGKDVISFCTSDETFKDEIVNIDDSLNKISAINGVTFKWNDKQSTHEGYDTGLIAQEVESLNMPGVVTTRADGTKAIKYERVVPLLVECIKELKQRVERLESIYES